MLLELMCVGGFGNQEVLDDFGEKVSIERGTPNPCFEAIWSREWEVRDYFS